MLGQFQPGPSKPVTSKRTHISTVAQLLNALREGRRKEGYLPILKETDIPTEELLHLCTWDPKHYTRNLLDRTDDFELFLICYEQGQRTSIHDYDSEEAWIRPIMGEVTEERFHVEDGKLTKVDSIVLTPTTFSYLHNGTSIHRYLNSHSGRSVTLNLYAKPLRKWTVYDERTGDHRTIRPGLSSH